jgi:cobalt-zinc-cadmium efflux system outer membrane protein
VRTKLLPMIVLGAMLALARGARAEAPAAPEPPAIDEARLATILAGDPRLARLDAEVDAARAEAIAAGVRPDPSVAVEREEIFPDGGLATNYLRLAVPLEISGQRAARVGAARALVDAAAAEGTGARFALSIQALRQLRIAAYERARVELLRVERVALAQAVEIVRRRTAAGAASGYDLQRIELELAAYDDLIAAAETQLGAARIELGALVGMAGGADAAGALELPADPPALEALLGEAVRGRAEYRAAGARLDGARALSRAADRAWIPDLAVSAGVMAQDVGGGSTASGYTAGLSLSIPIFDRGQAERARAEAQRRAAEADRRVLEREVPAAIRARHQALVQALARARAVQRDQLARLDQLLRSAETAYREGSGNVVELLDAHAAARDAKLRELELRRDARLCELELWLALGRRR